jgi:O-antigen/teichoic acid export membrane protein
MAAEKALLFRGVMLVEVFAALLGFSTAVLTALAGWGVISLILGAIVSAFFSTFLFWLFLSQGWRPKFQFDLVEVRSFLGFGASLVANNIVNQINLTIDLILGGRMLDASQLGLYSIPRDLVLRVQSIVNPIVTRVAFPLIAEVQCDIDLVRKIYLQMINMTASTNAPIYIGVAFFAEEVVEILLGDGWGKSAQILQVLAIWGSLRSIGNPVGSLLLGMGHVDLSLKWNLGLLMVVPPVVWFGSLNGPQGISLALLFLSVTLFIPGWFILVKPLCNAGLTVYSIAALRPLLISVLSVLPAFLVASNLNSSIYRLIIGFLIAAPLYLLLSFWLNREWIRAVFELIQWRRGLIASKIVHNE